MGENVVKNGFLSCVYEGNKGRFRFCHPDIKNFQLIDFQLIGFFYFGYLVSKISIHLIFIVIYLNSFFVEGTTIIFFHNDLNLNKQKLYQFKNIIFDLKF